VETAAHPPSRGREGGVRVEGGGMAVVGVAWVRTR
jgi:hypothetical protein